MTKATAIQPSNTGTGSSYDAQLHYEGRIYTTFQIDYLFLDFIYHLVFQMFDKLDPIPLTG